MQEEGRREPRPRSLKSGRIVFNNRFSVIDCTVRNLSAHGALLLVGPQGLPEEFNLELDAGAVTHPCKVRWRNARQVGVSFD